MPVLSLACHLRHNTPNIPSRYNNEQTTKQTKAINNSYIYINISCKCDTNRAGHFTLDAYASRPVACRQIDCLIHHLFRLTLNKPWKPAILALWAGKPPVTGGFPSQRTSNVHGVIIAPHCWHSTGRPFVARSPKKEVGQNQTDGKHT